ncbi:hypothetical protein SKAU_G00195420 [Synaphobranchus kaupii]|uniref:Uncharacterized protein n=1 Tax=Synaphobranchus kaupii TaxID=118154 RepID=A0A9Q1FEC9_SYNKA|nr:hypothetical protein SKAU_G00195420 [Synaphobranchus kaupii]
MIAYVHCLSPEPAASCWRGTCYEEDEELLPLFKRGMGNVPPKPEASLRRRLLCAKIHQKQDSLWTPKPLLGPQPRAPGLRRPGHTLNHFSQHRWKGTGLLPVCAWCFYRLFLTLDSDSRLYHSYSFPGQIVA